MLRYQRPIWQEQKREDDGDVLHRAREFHSLRRQSDLLLSKGGVFRWLHHVASHLFRVPEVEAAVRQNRMVPRLPFQGLKSTNLFLALRVGGQQNRRAGFGNDEQK